MKADSTTFWLLFLKIAVNDSRLNVWHLSLLLALIHLAHMQNAQRTIRVSRSKLMALSHINTAPTYHKYFKQIQDFGYIRYTPSYHPGFRSTVEFLIF
ncbi:hypothetical protein CLU96_2289 [Chryseobacterium sp. 52]|uniref:hypothetical protein n=1 Tax=Chryseobacterium sp. 52 TaxID=2035213 RepID=UPI000C17ED43|nr:hypothetical protein [Chryseobacterium sp. 52]PIF45287.1 hypothetical protein CLU96_2289 [Chryseobacterium sp. 52]